MAVVTTSLTFALRCEPAISPAQLQLDIPRHRQPLPPTLLARADDVIE
jgi:hypothetical protein